MVLNPARGSRQLHHRRLDLPRNRTVRHVAVRRGVRQESPTYGLSSWPSEIPAAACAGFGTWCAEHGVQGKYAIVPFPPASAPRLASSGWTLREALLQHRARPHADVPNWASSGIITIPRARSATATLSPTLAQFMRTGRDTGRSADESAATRYALRILRDWLPA